MLRGRRSRDMASLGMRAEIRAHKTYIFGLHRISFRRRNALPPCALLYMIQRCDAALCQSTHQAKEKPRIEPYFSRMSVAPHAASMAHTEHCMWQEVPLPLPCDQWVLDEEAHPV